jgi:cytochrome b561
MKYPLSIRILHWLMALIMIGLLCVGLYMEGLPKEDPMRGALYSLHKSFGVTVFLLFLIRWFLRARLGVPELPDVITAIEKLSAKLGHYALYGFMAAMPLSGYLMSSFGGRPVKLFGLELPNIVEKNPELSGFFREFHKYAAYTLIIALTLHVLAVIYHRVKERVNLLSRML